MKILRNLKSELNEKSAGSSIASSSSPLSVSSTANLIKPIETDSSVSSTSNAISSSSPYCHPGKGIAGVGVEDENLENYKNDLYRSSHQIIYKQQLFQQQQQQQQGAYCPKPKLASITGDEKPNLGLLYEARPFNVTSMWTSANSAVSLATVERDQMIERLNAAIANLNNSMCSNLKSSGEKAEENEKSGSGGDLNEQSSSSISEVVRQISCV